MSLLASPLQYVRSWAQKPPCRGCLKNNPTTLDCLQRLAKSKPLDQTPLHRSNLRAVVEVVPVVASANPVVIGSGVVGLVVGVSGGVVELAGLGVLAGGLGVESSGGLSVESGEHF
jgi:hypothetical protein